MTYFDFAFLAFLIVSALLGVYRGFLIEVISVASYVLAFIISLFFAPMFVSTVQSFGAVDLTLARVIAYVVVFLLALISLGLIKKLFETILKSTGLASVDRMFGMIFGILRGFLLFLCCALALSYTNLPREPWWVHAQFAPVVQSSLNFIGHQMPDSIATYWHFFP